MLSMITGKQRAGKTYYCVNLIRDYLKHYQARPLYANLPLNPDYLCKMTAGRNTARFMEYMQRLHMFLGFRHLSEAKQFHRLNPVYISLNRVSREIKDQYKNDDGKYVFTDDYYNRSDRLLFKQSAISYYWRYIKTNAVVFLDELYQWFHSSNAFCRELAEYRKELLTYTRQHGHSKDDLFLISHDMSDIDANIRKGVQYLYVIRNSKYTNMFEWRWMRGLKWPFQFFIVQGYEFGETVPSDSWNYFTDKRIFKCYNSFSSAETLGKQASSGDAVSSDTGVNFWWNFKRFMSQAWIGFAILGGLLFGSYKVYGFLSSGTLLGDQFSTFSTTSKNVNKNQQGTAVPGQKVLTESEKLVSDQISRDKKMLTVPTSYIVSVSPVCVLWADGFKIKKGQKYHGLHVHQISRDYITFINLSSNKSYRVLVAGARDYSRDPVRDQGQVIGQRQYQGRALPANQQGAPTAIKK